MGGGKKKFKWLEALKTSAKKKKGDNKHETRRKIPKGGKRSRERKTSKAKTRWGMGTL